MNVYKNNQICLAVPECPAGTGKAGLAALVPSPLPGGDADSEREGMCPSTVLLIIFL